MKGTTKGAPPPSFDQWLVDNDHLLPLPWRALTTEAKTDILEALIAEQGHVCVYCGASITRDPAKAHVEHFFPSSKFEHRRFAWHNLLASCGPPTKKGEPSICGDAKHDWIPVGYVDPTDPTCERQFQYDGVGDIAASPLGGAQATTMIGKLKLDDKSLVYQRYQIIYELEKQIGENTITAGNVAEEITMWRTRDGSERLKSLGHVAARYLEDQAL